MTRSETDCAMTLGNIFAAYIDQSTLEEAVVDMAGIGVGENHQEFLDALDWGIAQCESGARCIWWNTKSSGARKRHAREPEE